MVQPGAGAWSSGNALNAARSIMGGTGTQTAAIVFGGESVPGASSVLTEKYDGTSWTEVGDMPAIRQSMGSAGTQTAALSMGGTSSVPTG